MNKLYNKLKEQGVKFYCNDNISEFLTEKDLKNIEKNVEKKVEELLKLLLIDIENDHNTKETPKRIAKMLINDIFYGRYQPKPNITQFPNIGYDQLYVTGPITVRSTCAHHFMPIYGKAFIGIYPSKNVIGLSKFNRLIDWICSRPQIQEEMTIQIADEIEKTTEAEGVAVVVNATHMCLTHRGFREHENVMTTSVMRGVFRTDPEIKKEFLKLLEKY